MALAMLCVGGCSPASLFGVGKDEGVADGTNYRRINMACAGIELARADLTASEFRKLLRCFNAYGALDPIENLSNRLSDADLRPLVEAGNRYLIHDRKLLFELEKTYHLLAERNILDSTLNHLGRLLLNGDFISSGILLMRPGFLADRRSMLLAMRQLSTRMDPGHVSSLLDTGLSFARARAFQSMQSHFRGESPTGRPLQELTDSALRYLEGGADLGDRMLDEVANGDFFWLMDQTLGTEDRLFPATVPRMASAMDATLSNGAETMDGLTSLFHAVHRPIPCLKGAQTIPDGAMHVIGELVKRPTSEAGDYIQRTSPLVLSASAPMCDLPPELGQYYPAMYRLAGTTAIGPITETFKAAWNAPGPLLELIADFMADSGIKHLLPVLSELTDRHVWNDALLLGALSNEQDRAELIDTLHFLSQPIPGAGTSTYSVMRNAVARAGSGDLYAFVRSLSLYVESDHRLLEPALSALRQAYYVNDVHPMLEIARNMFEDAPDNDRLFDSMLVAAELPEFKESVRLVSEMARDGRLKQLLGAMLTLYHRYAAQGASRIHESAEPPFAPRSRHDLDEGGLAVFRIDEQPTLAGESCSQIDSRLFLNEYRQPYFSSQLGHFVSCANSEGAYGDLLQTMDFLLGHSNEHGTHYYGSTMDLLAALEMPFEALKYIGDSFVEAFNDGRFAHSLDSFKMFVRTDIHGESDPPGVAGPVLKMLPGIFAPISIPSVRAGLRQVETFIAGTLRREDFPRVLKYLDDLFDISKDPDPRPKNSYDWSRIKRWVGNKECVRFPRPLTPETTEQYKVARSHEVIGDYDDSVTEWELMPDGKSRRDWELDEFKVMLEPLLTKLGDPAQGVKPRSVMNALLDSMRYFTLPEGAPANRYQHYQRAELRKFVMDRSNDYKLITYYYPRENVPRVRLVNSLDRLELAMINADLWTPWPIFHGVIPDFKNQRNFGLHFLGEIADAWGDEDEKIWPEEIKKKYSKSRPPTLSQVVASMKATTDEVKGFVGYPFPPPCPQLADPKDPPEVQYAETHDPVAHGLAPSWLPGFHIPQMQRSLYNVGQVFSVLEENLPERGSNGMRVLRDLFFELAYSTPAAYRTADFHKSADGWRNNLSVILKLERIGVTHQAGRLMRGSNPSAPEVVDFFDSLITGATASPDPLDTTPEPRYEMHAVLDALFASAQEPNPAKPEHALFWAVLRPLFGIIDAGEGRPLDAEHQGEIEGKPVDEVARIRQEWVKDFGLLKQMGYYSFAATERFEVTGPMLRTIGAILGQYRPFLVENSDKIGSFLRGRRSAYLMRALEEDQGDPANRASLTSILRTLLEEPKNGLGVMEIVQAIVRSPETKNCYNVLGDRWSALTATPDYQALQSGSGNELLEFFEMLDPAPGAGVTARRTLDYLAERLESQELDQYFILAAQKPDGFFQVLETLGHTIDDGSLMVYFQEARDAMTGLRKEAGRYR